MGEGLRRNDYHDRMRSGDRWERILWQAMDATHVLVVHHGCRRVPLEAGERHGQRWIHHMHGHASLRDQRSTPRDHRGAEWEQPGERCC